MMTRNFSALIAVLVALSLGACSATRSERSTGEYVDDAALTAKVKAALIEDPVTKANDINVEAYRGVVQLGGFVDGEQQRTRAGEVARGIEGVTEVRNDLRVSAPQQSAGRVVDDVTINTAVKARLVEDETTKAHQINVETQRGVVQLSGFVESQEQKQRAGELARAVDGVSSVRNDLEIRQR